MDPDRSALARVFSTDDSSLPSMRCRRLLSSSAANTAYGGGVNPVGFKWIFATRGHVAPYLELNGGTLFTTHEVPCGNFDREFHPGRGLRLVFLLRASCVVGGCPLPAHFECRVDRAESGSEYGAGAAGIWEVLWEEVGDEVRARSASLPSSHSQLSSLEQRRKNLVDRECGSVGNHGHVDKLDGGPLPAIGLAAHNGQR